MLLMAAVGRADVTYQEVIRPLFQNSCLNCHNADKHKAGLDLSTYDATMDGSDNGKVVEAGNAEKSLLFKVLAHTEEPYMPKGADKLPDSQLDQIKQWIAANAPEKAGSAVAKKDTGPAVSKVAVEERPKGPPAMPHDGLLEPVVRTARAGAVPSVAGSPWAPLVALAAQKQVLLYNTDTLELAGVLPFPEGFPVIVRFSHNGSLLIAGGGVGAKLGHVVIWDVVTGKRVTEVGDEFDTVLAADISPDQSLVALGGPGKLVKIFSAADGKMICKMKKHTDWVTALCFTPEGKELISGDRAGGLAVWDTQGPEVQSMSAHAAAITGIACRGGIIATASEDGTVKFWDMDEGKEAKSWHAHDGGVRSIAFTPEGQIVTCGRDHFTRLWDTGGNKIKDFDALSDIAMQAAGAGGKIVAADWNGLVKVWTADGRNVGQLDSNPPRIAERIDAVNKRLAELQQKLSKDSDASKQAAVAVEAAHKKVLDAGVALDAKNAALAAAKSRAAALQKQAADAAAPLQLANEESAKLAPHAVAMTWGAACNPMAEPAACWAGLSRMLAGQLADGQKILQATISAVQKQCELLPKEIDAQTHAVAAAALAVKNAETALATAKATADKTAGEIKAANVDLLKWRTAAARVSTSTEYASRKTVGK